MLFQIAIAPSLTRVILQPRFHLLQQWLSLHPVLLEAGHVQPPDPLARHLEELAKDSIAHVRPVSWRCHQLAELQFDDVVDLLLSE